MEQSVAVFLCVLKSEYTKLVSYSGNLYLWNDLPMEAKFSVQFLSDVTDFLDTLDEKSRDKIVYNIYRARLINDVDLFKKLVDDIWEFRTLYNKTQYRLLAFWDKTGSNQTLVIATNGFVKKT